MMHDWKVSALPVLKGEGRVVGVVSEADLLPKEEFRDSDPGLPRSRLRSTGADPHHPAGPPVRPRPGRYQGCVPGARGGTADPGRRGGRGRGVRCLRARPFLRVGPCPVESQRGRLTVVNRPARER
jgi:CBS domain-containing protein